MGLKKIYLMIIFCCFYSMLASSVKADLTPIPMLDFQKEQLIDYIRYLNQVAIWLKQDGELLPGTATTLIQKHTEVLPLLGEKHKWPLHELLLYSETPKKIDNATIKADFEHYLTLLTKEHFFPFIEVAPIIKEHLNLNNFEQLKLGPLQEELLYGRDQLPLVNLTADAANDLIDYLEYLNTVSEWVLIGPSLLPNTIEILSNKHRKVAALIKLDLLSPLNRYANKEISFETFQMEFSHYLHLLSDGYNFPHSDTRAIIKHQLNGKNLSQLYNLTHPLIVATLKEKLSLSARPPMITRRASLDNNWVKETAIVGRYQAAKDTMIDAILKEIDALNGKMYHVREMLLPENCSEEEKSELFSAVDKLHPLFSSSYFQINQDGNAIIATDLTKPLAIKSLFHEKGHLENAKFWKELIRNHPDASNFNVQKNILESDKRIIDERWGVASEMKVDDDQSLWNYGAKRVARNIASYQFISRASYPYSEGIRDALFKIHNHLLPDYNRNHQHLQFAKETLNEAIAMADTLRKNTIAYHQGIVDNLIAIGHPEIAAIEMEDLTLFKTRPLFDLIFENDLERYQSDGTIDDLKKLFATCFHSNT
ncbi:MAG: hypothetical protein HQK52_08765 [Oligoflexia bacterium]|nr:hypothetical protein [Oligoflexia bacterium]